MEFSAFLIFVVCTTSMTYLTFGKERERALLFPDYYFFAKRRLENYTIETTKVKHLDDCELMCYLNDNCVSLNFKKDPDNNDPGHICELNNATHLKNDSDLTSDVNFYYRGSKNACDKSPYCENDATCQSGFTLKGYQCLCPPGFEGERCEKDIDECKTYPGKCHVNATCNNTNGSHVCTCKPGYTGNGRSCTDVDECKGNYSCHENAKCTNTIGSHVCECQPGYTGNGQICKADPCYHYKNLSEASRKLSYVTPDGSELCDNQLPEGWYRFVGAAGTKMPTTRVPAYRCGTNWSGWLYGDHPTVKDGEVDGKVCFSDRSTGCKDTRKIFVKNCGSYFIYKPHHPSFCHFRYCSTD